MSSKLKLRVASKSGLSMSGSDSSSGISPSNICVDAKSGLSGGALKSRLSTNCVEAKSCAFGSDFSDSSSGNSNICVAENSEGDSSSATESGSAGTSIAPGVRRGTKVPSKRRASDDLRKSAALQPFASWLAMSSAQRPKAPMAVPAMEIRLSLAGFCSARDALSICSKDHAASPNSLSPTILELPLSV